MSALKITEQIDQLYNGQIIIYNMFYISQVCQQRLRYKFNCYFNYRSIKTRKGVNLQIIKYFMSISTGDYISNNWLRIEKEKSKFRQVFVRNDQEEEIFNFICLLFIKRGLKILSYTSEFIISHSSNIFSMPELRCILVILMKPYQLFRLFYFQIRVLIVSGVEKIVSKINKEINRLKQLDIKKIVCSCLEQSFKMIFINLYMLDY
ncbi:unnamed protein product [Paramecium octaurelia]|uniref:Uncharacterized protein n=1 Tax=Paramecium octaurelia TaxID=43137 RepID=A0A8S1W6R0_PAROT|nr:unnamed protein product [Paramecium octaurelia]